MAEKIVASGCVIVMDNKLLVSSDGKDDFFKIPGGKVVGKEILENCALRELKEETGFSGKIVSKLSTMKLTKRPGTGEEVEMVLHHFKSVILDNLDSFDPFRYRGHEVRWLDVKNIGNGETKFSPNIIFLLNKGELK